MARFLHLADIHLGFDRYDNSDRTRDFFLAFNDVIERYAIADPVDFVLIAGDLFEHRSIQPATLNQAQVVLTRLQELNIPVLAIEGNHDNRPYGTKTSWLRYLADWGLLMLLEPGHVADGDAFYFPWDGHRGGYVDLECGVRVLGSSWYGAAAPKAIEQIATAIAALPPGPSHTILMFHHGLDGQIARYSGALRYTDLLPLKQAGVDYLALGHIHKSYGVEGWIYNPGSLEANSIEESQYERGAFRVHLSADGIHADLKRDYYQRPTVRLRLNLEGLETVEQVERQAIALIQRAIEAGSLTPEDAPIVELRIEGQVGFERLDLDTRQLQRRLQADSGALIFLLKYEVDNVSYGSPIADDSSRDQIEQEVFMDVLSAHSTYRDRAPVLAQGLIELKNLQLQGCGEDRLYDFVESLVLPDSQRSLLS